MKSARKKDRNLIAETAISRMEHPAPPLVEKLGDSVPLTCPECAGPIREIADAQIVRYRCQVGHAFTAPAMLVGRLQSIEHDLWHLVSSFEEVAHVAESLSKNAKKEGSPRAVAQFKKLVESSRKEQLSMMKTIQRSPVLRVGEKFPGAGGDA